MREVLSKNLNKPLTFFTLLKLYFQFHTKAPHDLHNVRRKSQKSLFFIFISSRVGVFTRQEGTKIIFHFRNNSSITINYWNKKIFDTNVSKQRKEFKYFPLFNLHNGLKQCNTEKLKTFLLPLFAKGSIVNYVTLKWENSDPIVTFPTKYSLITLVWTPSSPLRVWRNFRTTLKENLSRETIWK